MKKLLLFFSLSFLVVSTFGSQVERSISLIPEPVSVVKKGGYYLLPEEVVISVPAGDETRFVGNLLMEKLSTAPGKKIRIKNNAADANVLLDINNSSDSKIGDEGYFLTVTSDQIIIKANKPAGLLYGVQTLLQLFPPQIESNRFEKNISWQLPQVEITDYPRVGWRGLMLDVSRHFFTVDEVKQYLDSMLKYKYNMFHWHLTDDEGWRIEIKSLPKLTDVGAWRQEQTGWFGSFSQPDPDAPKNYGGFYTQEQIKEVIEIRPGA